MYDAFLCLNQYLRWASGLQTANEALYLCSHNQDVLLSNTGITVELQNKNHVSCFKLKGGEMKDSMGNPGVLALALHLL